jgi:ribonucleoside-diphosphate reductase alpha chain
MLTDNAIAVLEKRYFIKDENGKIIEDWDKLCRRVAHAVAQDEKPENKKRYEDSYYGLIYSTKFLPNSPALMNAGRPKGMLSACFGLQVKDDIESIMKTATDMVRIHKGGGGTGFNFSELRPAHSRVQTTSGVASGPISFMKMYNDITEQIKQGGVRRGASVGLLSVIHPNILDFIDCKQDVTKITNFNISVIITSVFMDALKNNKEYDLVDPHTKKTTGKLKAKDVFDKICNNAWSTGEPGLFFIDTVNEYNVYKKDPICVVNPCVTGGTLIATLNGNIPIKDLVGQRVLVYSWNPKTKLPCLQWMDNIHKTQEQAKVWKVTFDSGLELMATESHNLYSFWGNKVQIKDLRIGQRVRAFATSYHPDGHVRMHGWANNKTTHVWVHRSLYELYNGKIPDNLVINHLNGKPADNRIENMEILTVCDHNKYHYKQRVAGGFGKRKTERILNHKVMSVEFCGYEDVYNGSVENTHTYIIADDKYCGKYTDGIMTGIVSANCGEVGLRYYESCNLGSINVGTYYNFATEDVDWELLENDIRLATRFLDSVISVNTYPIKEITIETERTRKIGLGIMGFADLLIRLRMQYGSKESFEFAEKLMKFIQDISVGESEKLGVEKGICEACQELKLQTRNLWTTIIAPTGTISMIAGCSSGCEPLYAVAFVKTCMDNTKLIMINPLFEEALKNHKIELTDKLKEQILSVNSIQELDWVPKQVKKVFYTAADVSAENHVRMQAALQKYTHGGISKTINLSIDATVEDVKKAFLLAYELDCKGITVYRDGCRPDQVLSVKKEDTGRKVFNRTTIMTGSTEKIETPLGGLLLTINSNSHGDPGEVILNIGKSGGDVGAFCEALGRTISSALQHGVPLLKVAHQLKNIKGEDVIFHGGQKFTSIPDIVGKRLEQITKEKTENKDKTLSKCPECENPLWLSENCKTCPTCGYSKC